MLTVHSDLGEEQGLKPLLNPSLGSKAEANLEGLARRREMRVYMIAELRRFFGKARCPWCKAVEKPSSLTMEHYDHPGGVPVIQHGGQPIPQWVFGVCETCQHQWSFQRLKEMLAK